jgi:hypothetical protein
MRIHMFGWKVPDDAFGAFPPVVALKITIHRARLRQHICSECFAPIHIGERYSCTVYKELETNKISQYKCHVVCPYDGGL